MLEADDGPAVCRHCGAKLHYQPENDVEPALWLDPDGFARCPILHQPVPDIEVAILEAELGRS